MEPPRRRGPGRPPHKPQVPALPKNGIVETPMDDDNIIEFVSVEPMIFKSLFVYFKNLKSRDIHIKFRKSDITFLTRDHMMTSRVIATINCKDVNWYFCKQDVCVALNRENTEKLFMNIDKTFHKLNIEFRNYDQDYLWFIFRDHSLSKECQYKIPLTPIAADPDLFELENEVTKGEIDSKFPLQFTLSSKQFKKTISDASSYSDFIIIEKNSIDPRLLIKYDQHNMGYRECYHDGHAIKLLANVRDFECMIKLSNIRSLASSMVTDNISIMCRDNNDVLLKSDIDEKLMVVYTYLKSD